MKTPKTEKIFIINCPLLTKKRKKACWREGTKVHIYYVNHKPLKWISERGTELYLLILRI